MHASYSDITDRLGEPQWWDENAVPRYCEFEPARVANIYWRDNMCEARVPELEGEIRRG